MPQGIPQPSFTAGELAPSLYGRIDFELYYKGLRTCRNFIVSKYGGVDNRPGTQFIAPAYDSTKPVRLIPFQFNNQQQYVLVLGDKWMQVVCNGALIKSSGARPVTGVQAGVLVPSMVSQTQIIDGWDVVFYAGTKNEPIEGFGFSIPDGATINGLVVQYLQAGGSIVGDVLVKLMKAGSDYGDERILISNWNINQVPPLGGSADLWGGSWTPADINDVGFGVDASVQAIDEGTTYWWARYVQITVYYTASGAGQPVYLTVPGHPFVDNQHVVVTGVAAGLNGIWTIKYIDANTIGLVGCYLQTIPWSGGGTVQNAGMI